MSKQTIGKVLIAVDRNIGSPVLGGFGFIIRLKRGRIPEGVLF